MQSAQNWQHKAVNLRGEQRMDEALAAIAEARRLSPADPLIAFMHAQLNYEMGYPAAALFAEVCRLWPDNADAFRNQALAMMSEQCGEAAQALLEGILINNPLWLNGHQALATLKWTSGDKACFADSLARAAHAHPDHAALWQAWFQVVAQSKDWGAATAILDEAERALGSVPFLLSSRLFVACERGDRSADNLIAKTKHFSGDGISLCRIRHALRQGDAKLAEAEAQSYVDTPSAALFWPYLSLAWRLQGDERAYWLDRPDHFIQHRDDVMSSDELAELSEMLMSLHTAQAPYIDQSVRGGTQTDRSVLLRHEPILQQARRALIDTMRDYISALPVAEPGHPLLSQRRDGDLLIEGSWSVRLLPGGHNVPHSHPRGWLSTAFYVDVPESGDLGDPPAGHIAFGTPPPELGLDLPTYCTIAPQKGRLAIFPSTMWHGTHPFDRGERLVISFDLRQ